MPSSELPPLEEQASTSEFMPAQVVNLDNGEPVACQQVPCTASPAKQPLDGQAFESSTLIQTPRNATENSSTPIGSSSHGHDISQDPLQANILRSPGFIPPPFSYNMAPQMASPTAPSQQSPSDSITRLTAPMPPASLQPPVPGQSSGNKPFFSYNVVPHANISPAPVQQFQLTTTANRSQLQGENIPMFTYSSQPSDLGKPPGTSSSRTGEKVLPVPSQNNVDSEVALVSTPSTNSQSILLSTSTCSNPGITPNPVRPSFNASPRVPGISGSSRPQGPLPSRPISSSVAGRPMVPDSYASKKPFVPSSYSATPNSVSFPVQPHLYQQPHQFLHAVATPSQAAWLQPGIVHNPPFSPYPGLMLAPSPFRYGIPSHTMINSRPPGLSTSSTSMENSSFAMEKTILPPSDRDKQTDSLNNNEESISNNVINAWMAHKTEEGVIYYYNSLTRESTYDKPSSFKLEPDRITSQPTPVSWERLSGTDWALVTTNDGKKYYYDTRNKVSSWQIPLEVEELKNHKDLDVSKASPVPIHTSSSEIDNGPIVSTLDTPALDAGGRYYAQIRNSVSSSTLDLVKKKLHDAGGPTISSPLHASSAPLVLNSDSPKINEISTQGQHVENNKEKLKDPSGDGNLSESTSDSEDTESGPTMEQCMMQFKEMLKERGIAPFSKWDKELPKIIFDSRFKAVPSHATRRSLFEHYVRTRAEEERKEKRVAQKAAIEGFKKLLEEALEDINKRTNYHTFKRKWGNDSRFEALNRKDREQLLNERVLSLKKAAEQKMQATRAVVVSEFESMLKETGDITSSSRWSRVKDSFRNDPRYNSIKHEEREALFNEYLSKLKAMEIESEIAAKAEREEQDKLKRREQEMRKRKQRDEQEMESLRLKVLRKEAETSYHALLVETIKDPKASWTESKPKLEKDPQGRFTSCNLVQADMENLFRVHVKSLYERCVQDFCALLIELVTAEAASTQVTDKGKTVLTSWSEAKRHIKHDSRYLKVSSKDRENLWVRHVKEILSPKNKSVSKEKMDAEWKMIKPFSSDNHHPFRRRGSSHQ